MRLFDWWIRVTYHRTFTTHVSPFLFAFVRCARRLSSSYHYLFSPSSISTHTHTHTHIQLSIFHTRIHHTRLRKPHQPQQYHSIMLASLLRTTTPTRLVYRSVKTVPRAVSGNATRATTVAFVHTTASVQAADNVQVEHGRGQWKTYGDVENYKPGRYQIGTFNSISPVGLARFPPEEYDIRPGAEAANAHALLLRSHKLQESEVPHTVRAIARYVSYPMQFSRTIRLPTGPLSHFTFPLFCIHPSIHPL
jgi:hypothetical protein